MRIFYALRSEEDGVSRAMHLGQYDPLAEWPRKVPFWLLFLVDVILYAIVALLRDCSGKWLCENTRIILGSTGVDDIVIKYAVCDFFSALAGCDKRPKGIKERSSHCIAVLPTPKRRPAAAASGATNLIQLSVGRLLRAS